MMCSSYITRTSRVRSDIYGNCFVAALFFCSRSIVLFSWGIALSFFLEHPLHSVFVCCMNCVQYMTDRQWHLVTQKAPVGAHKRVVNFLDDNKL